MTSAPVTRMDRAQRRRLMAALVAEAMAKDQIAPDAVDFAALLFGDPQLWTDVGGHGAIVAGVLANSPKATTPTAGRFVGKTQLAAMRAVENEIVRTLELEATQATQGGGKSGDDTEYRRIRSKLANYVRYLGERSVYEDLNGRLREAYATLHAGSSSAEDLAKEFSLPLEEVALCRAGVGALIKIAAAQDQASLPSLVPIKNGRPRRGLLLMDTSGRPRWGKRRHGGASPFPPNPDAPNATGVPARQVILAAPSANGASPTIDRDLADGAILRARMGLVMDDAHKAALSPDWATALLEPSRIIQLMAYPRPCYLDDALAAFGHPSQQKCIARDPAIAVMLESQAAPFRRSLIQRINRQEPVRPFRSSAIGDQWWRALTFCQDCRLASGEAAVGPRWPESWEYLGSASDDVYTDDGRLCVVLLDTIVNVLTSLYHIHPEEWSEAFGIFESRGDYFVPIVALARRAASWAEAAQLLVRNWVHTRESLAVIDPLPGFRG